MSKDNNSRKSFIFRARVKSDYVVVPNLLAQNPNLSLQAKGLLVCLLSLPEGWRVAKYELHKRFCTNGRDSTVKAFNELIKLGYVQAVPRMRENLKKVYDYYVYPVPLQWKTSK